MTVFREFRVKIEDNLDMFLPHFALHRGVVLCGVV